MGRTNSEVEAPILWPLGVKNCLGRLKVGGEGDDILRWLEGITDSMDMSLSQMWELVKDRKSWSAAFHGIAESDMTYQHNNNDRLPLLNM